jgi:hypothetical protein
MCSLNHYVTKHVVEINADVAGRSLKEISQDQIIVIDRRRDIPEVWYFLAPYFVYYMMAYLSCRHAGQ